MIGIDESCNSATISCNESDVHEPGFLTAQNLALALKVPVAFFYCNDDILAKMMVDYSNLSEQMRIEFQAQLD